MEVGGFFSGDVAEGAEAVAPIGEPGVGDDGVEVYEAFDFEGGAVEEEVFDFGVAVDGGGAEPAFADASAMVRALGISLVRGVRCRGRSSGSRRRFWASASPRWESRM